MNSYCSQMHLSTYGAPESSRAIWVTTPCFRAFPLRQNAHHMWFFSSPGAKFISGLAPLAPLAPQRHLRAQNPIVHRRTCAATLDFVVKRSEYQEYLRHIWKYSSREHSHEQINGLWWCMSQDSETQTMRSGTCYHHWCWDNGVIVIWARANYHCGSCCGNLLQLAKCQARQGNWFRFVVAHAKRFKEVGMIFSNQYQKLGFSKYLATIAQELHFVPCTQKVVPSLPSVPNPMFFCLGSSPTTNPTAKRSSSLSLVLAHPAPGVDLIQ